MELDSDPQSELQRQTQRLLGRCMLRIQQYERKLKGLLIAHEVAGPATDFQALQAERAKEVEGRTLGGLKTLMFDSLVVPDKFQKELLPSSSLDSAMGFGVRIHMADEQLAATKAAVSELVALRNELVHHLIDRFDLGSAEGCILACRHLEASYEIIDRHVLQLHEWGQSLLSAGRLFSEFSQSSQFSDVLSEFLRDGHSPDGAVEWSSARIVRSLRDAAEQLGVGGWTRVDLAREWIAARHPEQTPSRYGCRSWGQVLADSKLFVHEYRRDADGRKLGWYRCLGADCSRPPG
jgi:hypothetical protein